MTTKSTRGRQAEDRARLRPPPADTIAVARGLAEEQP